MHADTAKDITKIEVPAVKTDKDAEYFTMVFEQAAGGANLIMAWENVKAVLPITFRQQ